MKHPILQLNPEHLSPAEVRPNLYGVDLVLSLQ
jgi:hypothetical protein